MAMIFMALSSSYEEWEILTHRIEISVMKEAYIRKTQARKKIDKIIYSDTQVSRIIQTARDSQLLFEQ